MAAGVLNDRPVFMRQLAPQDLKLEMARTTASEAEAMARYLGGVVGRAHGRQMDPDTRASWSLDLAGDHSRALDAPTWLWRSVVDLVALHEAAYLDHCRLYALAQAA